MDVDAPNILKRCSSAPLINEASTATSSPTTTSTPRDTTCFSIFGNSNQHRTRRFSASFSPLAHSPNSCGPRLTPRVNQLRQEECADVANSREVAHEKETHSAMQMSQSWEDLTLMTAALGGTGASMSPTRLNRFSPGVSLSPGVSPSPTRKAFTTRRSLSPIAMRPSCLSPVGRPSGLISMKRRFDIDDMPAAKRCCWTADRRTPSTPGTPDSLADSPSPSGFTFRPVSPRVQSNPESQNNAEENNDVQSPS